MQQNSYKTEIATISGSPCQEGCANCCYGETIGLISACEWPIISEGLASLPQDQKVRVKNDVDATIRSASIMASRGDVKLLQPIQVIESRSPGSAEIWNIYLHRQQDGWALRPVRMGEMTPAQIEQTLLLFMADALRNLGIQTFQDQYTSNFKPEDLNTMRRLIANHIITAKDFPRELNLEEQLTRSTILTAFLANQFYPNLLEELKKTNPFNYKAFVLQHYREFINLLDAFSVLKNLGYRHSKGCIFLNKNNLCGIYSFRPLVCKIAGGIYDISIIMATGCAQKLATCITSQAKPITARELEIPIDPEAVEIPLYLYLSAYKDQWYG